MTYLVLTNTEKQGVMSPDIIGPFKDEAHLDQWLTTKAGQLVREWQDASLDAYGGYTRTIMVNSDSATSPDKFLTNAEETGWFEDE